MGRGSSHTDPNIWQLKLSGLTNNSANVYSWQEKFSLESIVFIINRHSPVPPVPPPGSSEATILEYDRAYLWVAKVLEVRAKDDQHVYLRVFWLYWPDELPNKRQSYHGGNELIMSNAMDIVDAMTVAGPAAVTHWD